MTPAESHLREAVENGYPHHTLTIDDGRELLAEIDRLTRERDEAREESEAVRFANVEGKMWVDNAVHDIRQLSSAIRWALGYDEGDPQFGEQAEQKGAFAWRAELRRRAGDALAQIEQERSEQAKEG